MFMQKIDLPRVACDLFDVEPCFYGTGNGSSLTGDKPRSATEAEARAYADFIRRKAGLPEIGKAALHHAGGYGRATQAHFHYVGATFGREISRGEYEPGAFSVLFPGANQMRATVTLETLDETGVAISSQTMPVEPKKGGVIWSKDAVHKAAGPVDKPKRARTPTRIRRGATVDKRRRAVLMALRLRKQLRRERAISADRLRHIFDLTSGASRNCTAADAQHQAPVARHAWPKREASPMRDLFRALYAMARRDKLTGADLLHAACDLTGEPQEAFRCPRAALLHTAVTRAIEAPEGLRYRLQRNVLNGWGARHGLRSPAMESPRFDAWRKVSCQADALRKRLAEAERLEYDAGNWVVRVLPRTLPAETDRGAIGEAVRPKRTAAHERAIRRAWAERKARRDAELHLRLGRAQHEQLRAQYDNAAEARTRFLQGMMESDQRERIAMRKRRRAVLLARGLQRRLNAEFRLVDRNAARMRESENKAIMQESRANVLAAQLAKAGEDIAKLQRRAIDAEGENAELWREIEALTAPATQSLAA